VGTAEPIGPPLQQFQRATAAAFSPLGDLVATGSMSGAVHVWQPTTGRLVAAPLRHGTVVVSVEFGPDGRQLVTRDAGGIVRVWDLAGSAVPPSAVAPSELSTPTELSPRSRRLAQDLDLVRLLDTQTGRLVGGLRHGGSIVTMAFSPDGRRLVAGCTDGAARVWDALTGRPLGDWVRHRGWVSHADFSPDGRLVVTAGQDRVASIWNPETARQVAELRHDQAVRWAEFSPDGRHVVTGTGDFASPGEFYAPLSDPRRTGEARVWDVATGRPVTPPVRHAGAVQRAVFSPDGRRFLTVAAGGPDSRNVVQVWETATGRPVSGPLVHPQGVFVVVFSPETSSGRTGRLLATGCIDGGVRLWDVAAGQAVRTLSGHSGAVSQVAFSEDGRRLVTASEDGTARLWDVVGGQLIAVLPHASAVGRASFADDGYSITTSCQNGTVRTWWLGPPDTRPAEDWAALARLLSGGRADPEGGTPMTVSVLEQTWQDLRTNYPHDFTPSRDEQIGWHQAATEEARGKKAWSAAAFHLGQLLAVDPGRWPDRLARARLLARLEKWDEAQAEFTRAVKRHAGVADVWLARGSFLLSRGKRDEAAADFRNALDLQGPGRPAALSEFWVAGLYGEDLQKAYPPESQTDPSQPLPPVADTREALPRWRAETADPAGYLDLGACFDHAEHISAYALACIYSPKEQDVALMTGSDDSLRLWLNGGEPLVEHPRARPPFPDDDHIPARLRAGWNVVLAKVVNYSGRHGLYLRLSAEPADLARAFAARGKLEQALPALAALLEGERGKPGEAAVLIERGSLRARLGRWKEAADDLAAGLRLDPNDHRNWYVSGAVSLQLGDRDGYRRACQEMLRRFGNTRDPMIAERTAKLCFVWPEAAGDLARPLRLAEEAASGTERHNLAPFFQAVKGFADYRAGRYEQSLDPLQKSAERLPDPIFKAQSLLYRAMALHSLRRAGEARQTLDQARKMLDGRPTTGGDLGELWFDGVFSQVLQREAQGLIDGPVPEAKTQDSDRRP
jgi:WD40 repeat protein/tetratricopeptide (TPR) repeat protein